MQCAAQIRRKVMDAELLNPQERARRFFARGLVPISLQDVQPRKHFVPRLVYRAVSLFRASGRALTVPPSWFCNGAAAV